MLNSKTQNKLKEATEAAGALAQALMHLNCNVSEEPVFGGILKMLIDSEMTTACNIEQKLKEITKNFGIEE